MSISSLFNTSKLGIFSSQSALKVVSHNIANVNTPGFSRQNAVLTTSTPNAQRIGQSVGESAGDGVMVSGINQVVDNLVERRLMLGEQELGRLEARDRFMVMVEEAFNDMDGDGFATRLEDFFAATDGAADNPTNPVIREEVVANGRSFADFVSKMHKSLSEIALPIDQEVTKTLEDINQLLVNIKDVNDLIVQRGAGPDQALDLRDQRKNMTNELSKLVDIEVLTTEDGNGVRIMTQDGQPLLDAEFVGSFSRSDINPEHGFQGIQINERNNDYTANLKGGVLKGLIEVRDEILHGSNGFLQQLDDVVSEIRFRVNHEHSQSVNDTLYSQQIGVFTLGSDLSSASISALADGGGVPVSSGGAVDSTVTVSAMDQTHNLYPSAGTTINMTYDAASGQFNVTENGTAASYSPVSASFPGAANLWWTQVSFTNTPNDGDSYTFDVPAFDAPPDLDRVAAGSITFAHGADTDTLSAFSVAIDPTTMTVNDVVSAINNATDNNGAITASINASNKMVLQSSTGNVYGVVDDSSGVLAAFGVGAFFAGQDVQNLSVNEELIADSGLLGTGQIDNTSGTPVYYDASNQGIINLSDLRSLEFALNNQTASFAAHYATAVGTLGSQKQLNDEALTAQEAAQNFMSDLRESISGVSLEEEMTDMMKFQRAFQASSKMITVADQLMETLISMV
ncbi:flagellar hook-associated protein FlgK [Magnetococcales bacterium HHB-1]